MNADGVQVRMPACRRDVERSLSSSPTHCLIAACLSSFAALGPGTQWRLSEHPHLLPSLSSWLLGPVPGWTWKGPQLCLLY